MHDEQYPSDPDDEAAAELARILVADGVRSLEIGPGSFVSVQPIGGELIELAIARDDDDGWDNTVVLTLGDARALIHALRGGLEDAKAVAR